MPDVQYSTMVFKKLFTSGPGPFHLVLSYSAFVQLQSTNISLYHRLLLLMSYLCPRPLPPYWKPHGVPSPPICTHILQSSYVVLHFSSQVVLNLHVRKFGGQVQDGRILQRADLRPGMDVKSRHDALRHFRTDAIEGFEGALRVC